jgi:hypothetical protein
MTEGFQTVLAASDEERRDLFVGAADRLRTNEQNIEKDFWVCWTLDALMSLRPAGHAYSLRVARRPQRAMA